MHALSRYILMGTLLVAAIALGAESGRVQADQVTDLETMQKDAQHRICHLRCRRRRVPRGRTASSRGRSSQLLTFGYDVSVLLGRGRHWSSYCSNLRKMSSHGAARSGGRSGLHQRQRAGGGAEGLEGRREAGQQGLENTPRSDRQPVARVSLSRGLTLLRAWSARPGGDVEWVPVSLRAVTRQLLLASSLSVLAGCSAPGDGPGGGHHGSLAGPGRNGGHPGGGDLRLDRRCDPPRGAVKLD